MISPDLAADLALAGELADAADAISLPRFGAGDLRVTQKPDMTPVSDADLSVELALRDLLSRRRPADAVLGEEYAASPGHATGAVRPAAPGTPPADGSAAPAAPGTPPADGSAAPAPAAAGTPGTPGTPSAPGAPAAGTPAAPAVAAGGRCWVIDPIDGTKNYVRGVPVWATLIALLVGGHPVLGTVSAPALARRWWGADGHGAFTTFQGGPERACRVSAVTAVSDASLSLSDLVEWEDAGLGQQVQALSRSCWRTRGYGDFYSYMLLAEGAVDIAAEPELKLWDWAPLVPVVTAAGGTFTAVDGTRMRPASTSALATNGHLHADVLAALQRR